MTALVQFMSDHAVAFAGLVYFVCVLATHIPGPVGGLAKWLLAGKVVKPPVDPAV
jgi:hypothetical protein